MTSSDIYCNSPCVLLFKLIWFFLPLFIWLVVLHPLPNNTQTHTIHVWYIHLHLVDFDGKCRQIYHTWIPMGNNAKLELSQFLLGPPNESTLRRGGSVSHGPGRVWGLKVIHGARISDPTNGQSLVQMDLLPWGVRLNISSSLFWDSCKKTHQNSSIKETGPPS